MIFFYPQNGTGIYGSIWLKMKSQHQYLLDSTEEGIALVKKRRDVAVIGGRETFYYNAKRFGVQHFHLSQRLYTRYSAIALQIGCPFVEHFNKLIINMFESGILSKITEDEYQKLREKKDSNISSGGSSAKRRDAERMPQKGGVEATKEIGEGKTQIEDDEQLKPMSMKTLQGAFYVLLVGCSTAEIFLRHFVLVIKAPTGLFTLCMRYRKLPIRL
ncbi:unnamed protein product [Nesidiocoris tenuis]|uniref:Ionotropic glutamate receptor C-terminal domain-containing protein n=1 Tax=Nesidiocoris tenuis TaxID=355587 RepID=A0A6H5GUL7_9HEMI|nr:unnamed protein product [Nesidiocoris tenuis]